jgi:hypothetical protein
MDNLVDGEYASQTPVIKEALITDQQAINSELNTFYQAAVIAALADVDEVAQLTAALATLETEDSAYKTAQSGLITTTTTLLRALADYAINNNNVPVINNDGTITGLIELNAEALTLVTDITEASHPGIDALLIATAAKEAADITILESEPSAKAAAEVIDILDLNTVAHAPLSLLGRKFTQTTPVDIIRPTTLEIAKEVTDLATITENATLAAEIEAATTAQANFDSAKTSYDNAANTNPLIDALNKAQAQADTSAKAITDLATAIALQNAAQNNLDRLQTLNSALDKAAQSFTNIGLGVPQVVAGATAGTDVNDTWLSGMSDAVISDFSALDSLSFATAYALNKSTTAGGNSADSLLEMWLTEEGGNSLLTFESTMTGGSALPQSTFSITLTGVALADIQLVDGFITLF